MKTTKLTTNPKGQVVASDPDKNTLNKQLLQIHDDLDLALGLADEIELGLGLTEEGSCDVKGSGPSLGGLQGKTITAKSKTALLVEQLRSISSKI